MLNAQLNKEYNSNIINEYNQVSKLLETFQDNIKTKDSDIIWKKSRVLSSIIALKTEIEELNKYIIEGESEAEKKNNTKCNKIMSNIMPLMTHMWFNQLSSESELTSN